MTGRAFFASAATVLALACSSALLDPSEQRELRSAEARWAEYGLTDYSFAYRHDCFCADGGRRVQITVRSGLATDVTPADAGGPLAAQAPSGWPTVDTLFARLDALVGNKSREDWEFDAQYDPTLGYPTTIRLTAPSSVADAGSIEEITELASLP